jgi:hypothetical protein
MELVIHAGRRRAMRNSLAKMRWTVTVSFENAASGIERLYSKQTMVLQPQCFQADMSRVRLQTRYRPTNALATAGARPPVVGVMEKVTSQRLTRMHSLSPFRLSLPQ